MNFPDSPGKEQNVLTTGTEIWIGQGLVDQAECSAYICTFFGYLRCTDSLSELESIGRSNLTWPASPAMELERTVLRYNRLSLIWENKFPDLYSLVIMKPKSLIDEIRC